MKKPFVFIAIGTLLLAACGGTQSVKPTPSSPQTSKQSAPSTSATKPGGYYLDDGPGDNPPQNIDSIPNAVPKNEPYLTRTNKPYRALGATYTPMTAWQPYKERGVASWYGKRYHGKKTASGEVYDMYSMSAAHTTLPLPSYVKVTNPANGRFVIVRVNDRGPFKSNRLIDLSYAAAYQLRFTSSGSTLV
ncbi:MAG: septal ring lytic transglycosylase RlpA family protein, partial [Pseudomonadota bacterium]